MAWAGLHHHITDHQLFICLQYQKSLYLSRTNWFVGYVRPGTGFAVYERFCKEKKKNLVVFLTIKWTLSYSNVFLRKWNDKRNANAYYSEVMTHESLCVRPLRKWKQLKLKQELKALLDPEFSIITTFNISRTIWMIKSLKIVTYVLALDLLLHVLVLHHVMQFRNFYLVFLSVSQQGIAPCYTILE